MPPPESIRPPRADEAHVWLAQLDDRFDAAILSDPERKRAARIIRPEAALRWAASRATLRMIVARYTGQPAQDIPLEPLGPQPPLGALNLGVSHSGDLLAVAFGAVEVAIDIELDREVNEPERLAARLGPEAMQALTLDSPTARSSALLQAWTRYEARLKLGAPDPWLRDFRFVGAAGTLAAPNPLKVQLFDYP